jgi:MOSC domain-containing protein
MAHATHTELGTVVSLWRYPVKSMLGEEVHTAQVRDHGLLGDRAYALLDSADGKVATAKNPRKWPRLFAFRATCIEPLDSSAPVPPVRFTLPDGTSVTSEHSELNQVLSQVLNRQVTLATTARGLLAASAPSSGPAPWTVQAEEYWPDMDGLDYRDTVTDFALPTGTFFDCATVHLLTTATLNRLRECYPQGQFEVQRFRPNIVVEPVGGAQRFAEQAWIGHTLAIGDEVRLHITGPCGRCVMTTLAQGELPQDPNILRTAVRQSQGHVGVYATVVQGGTMRRRDRVRLVD